MRDIVDDEQRRDRLATPMRPKGCGGAWASASLALLDNVTALPASRRLASAQAALATRHILILGHAPSAPKNVQCPIFNIEGKTLQKNNWTLGIERWTFKPSYFQAYWPGE